MIIVLRSQSNQNRLINPTRLTATCKRFLFFFFFTLFLLALRRRYPGVVVTTGRLPQPSWRREKWTPPLWGTTTKSRSWPPSCSPSLRRTLRRRIQDSNDRYGGSSLCCGIKVEDDGDGKINERGRNVQTFPLSLWFVFPFSHYFEETYSRLDSVWPLVS